MTAWKDTKQSARLLTGKWMATTTSGRDDDEAGLVVENQRLQFSVFDEGTMDETLGMA